MNQSITLVKRCFSSGGRAWVIVLFAWSMLNVQAPEVRGVEIGDVDVSGAYMGVLHSLKQKDRPSDDPTRDQFDYAANLDLQFKLRRNITGIVQLQGGAGDGSLGFEGPEIVVTDLNLRITDRRERTVVTIGSFDTPFGEEIKYLTNNADASANNLLMNSLFYSAFAGTNVGTPNTLGIMGSYTAEQVDFALAITNGTDQSAANADGTFEVVSTFGMSPVTGRDFRVAGSFIYSEDQTRSGSSGLESEFAGWLLEARYMMPSNVSVKGYYGLVDFSDKDASTDDNVRISMLELAYHKDGWGVAGRLSGWKPEDNDGSGDGISLAIPNPGLALSGATAVVPTDQRVARIQIGGEVEILDILRLKAEWFKDDYKYGFPDRGFDVSGMIVSLNALFP